jgi:ABC-type transporter Mla subunit MlaD
MTTSTAINTLQPMQNVFQQITNQHLSATHQNTNSFVNAMGSQQGMANPISVPQDLNSVYSSLHAQNNMSNTAQMAVFDSLSTQITQVSNNVESVIEQLFLMQEQSFLMHQQMVEIVESSAQSSMGGFGD